MWVYLGLVILVLYFLYTRKKRTIRVIDLQVFPIKSCGPIKLKSLKTSPTGFLFDREWIILDRQNKMVTQRDDSRLLRLIPSLNVENSVLKTLDLDYEGKKYSHQPCKTGEIISVVIWGVECEGIDEGQKAQDYLSSIFGKDYRLFRIHKHRQINKDKSFVGELPDDFKANFTDTSQALVISVESYVKTKESVPEDAKDCLSIDNFRGNIVLDGCQPFEENTWSKFKIGSVEFMGIGKCPRCKVTTVNHKNLEYHYNFEPVNTLRKINGNGTKGYFGQFSVRLCDGEVKIGDLVDVKEKKRFPDI